jgi:hypothetical protein
MLIRYEQLDRTLDYVEREALAWAAPLVNTLPFRRRRVVDGQLCELDGFCGERPDRIRAPRTSVRLGRDRRAPLLRGRAGCRRLYTFCPGGETTPAELVAMRDDATHSCSSTSSTGIRIETTVRAVSASTVSS